MSVLYSFKTDKSNVVAEWLKATKERGKNDSMIKNPFLWRIKRLTRKGKFVVVVETTILFPNFSWIGWMMGAMIILVFGATKWLIPCLVLGCLGVFWTSEFFFLMTKKALRKSGYSGPIKRLKHSDTIREVIL